MRNRNQKRKKILHLKYLLPLFVLVVWGWYAHGPLMTDPESTVVVASQKERRKPLLERLWAGRVLKSHPSAAGLSGSGDNHGILGLDQLRSRLEVGGNVALAAGRELARRATVESLGILLDLFARQTPGPGFERRALEAEIVAEESIHEVGEKAIPALEELAENHTDALGRSYAASALLKVAGEDAKSTVLSLLRRDPDPEVRENVAGWAGEMDDSMEAFVALKQAVLHDPDANVRATAALSLSNYGGKARSILQQALDNEQVKRVRRTMESALGAIR